MPTSLPTARPVAAPGRPRARWEQREVTKYRSCSCSFLRSPQKLRGPRGPVTMGAFLPHNSLLPAAFSWEAAWLCRWPQPLRSEGPVCCSVHCWPGLVLEPWADALRNTRRTPAALGTPASLALEVLAWPRGLSEVQATPAPLPHPPSPMELLPSLSTATGTLSLTALGLHRKDGGGRPGGSCEPGLGMGAWQAASYSPFQTTGVTAASTFTASLRL